MRQSIRKMSSQISQLAIYHISPESLVCMFRIMASAAWSGLAGIPRLEGTPETIAKTVIQKNCSKFLLFNRIIKAGAGHFVYEWLVDTAKALRGIVISEALPIDFLKSRVNKWIAESLKKGYVPTCFSGLRSFDIPRPRADNLPWLIHSLDCLGQTEEKAWQLKILLDNYLKRNFDLKSFLLKPEVNGDWTDSVLRPSSTYNNLCLLRALKIMAEYGYRDYANGLERSLLEQRWTGNYFRDYQGSGDWLSGDAAATALYFELFSQSIRNKIADSLESSGLLKPLPLKLREGEYAEFLTSVALVSPRYHSLIWPHIGCMALNGFKALGRDYQKYQEAIEDSIRKYGNFLEVFDEKGKPYRASRFLHATEWGLTMFAGQYLELIS